MGGLSELIMSSCHWWAKNKSASPFICQGYLNSHYHIGGVIRKFNMTVA